MFSEWLRDRSARVALVLFCALAGGCGPNKAVPSSSGLSLGGSQAGCLSKAGDAAVRFFNGTATNPETGSIWDCAISSLQLFESRTRGARPGVYSPQELRSFLEYFFLDKGTQISDKLLAEAMVLKRTLIGGRADELTHQDFVRAIALFEKLKAQCETLRTFMPLTPQAMASKSEADVEAAAKALRGAAAALGGTLEDTGVPYFFSDLEALATELHKLMGDVDSAPLLSMLRAWMPLIKAAKATLIAPEGDRISGSEWSALLTTGAQWYGLVLRLGSLNQHEATWLSGRGRELLRPMVFDAFRLIDDALARHPRGQISFDELNQLIEAAVPQGLIISADVTVTIPHLEAFVKELILRYMGGADTGITGRAAPGLTRPAWARLRSHFEHWNDGQRYLEAMFDAAAKEQGVTASGMAAAFETGFPSEQLQEFSLDRLISLGELRTKDQANPAALLQDAANRLQQVIVRDRPMFPGEATQIHFDGHQPDFGYSLHDLTDANWKYELGRILTAGYAEDPARAATDDDETQTLSFPEFKAFIQGITDVGDDIKFIDPNDPNEAEKRFREAELFTFAGTGSNFISSRQAAHLLALMISGKLLANQIHQEVIDSGCKTLGMDPYDYYLIDTECYRKRFFGNVEHFWRNMPKLAAYYRSLKDPQRTAFEHAMEDGARKLGYSPQPMNSSDSEGFAMIGQYIEVIFARYDADDSGALDWDEAETAFPIFKGTLEELSCAQGHCLHSEGDLKAVFTYMLATGHSPSAAAFVRWRYLPFFRNLSADRGTLMQIFGALGKPTN